MPKNKTDTYSLLISREQIIRLKQRKMKKISHKSTFAWKNLFLNPRKNVRFFHNLYSDEIILNIKSIKRIWIKELHEEIITITVGEEVLP